jgi:hypothetical protein
VLSRWLPLQGLRAEGGREFCTGLGGGGYRRVGTSHRNPRRGALLLERAMRGELPTGDAQVSGVLDRLSRLRCATLFGVADIDLYPVASFRKERRIVHLELRRLAHGLELRCFDTTLGDTRNLLWTRLANTQDDFISEFDRVRSEFVAKGWEQIITP